MLFLETSGGTWSQSQVPGPRRPHFWTLPSLDTSKHSPQRCQEPVPNLLVYCHTQLKSQRLTVCVLVEKHLWTVEKAWPKIALGSSSLPTSLTPLSPEGKMVGRDRLYKLEPADVMTLLARRHDRIIGPFPMCQNDMIFSKNHSWASGLLALTISSPLGVQTSQRECKILPVSLFCTLV